MTKFPRDAAKLEHIRSLALDDPERIAFESDPEAAARLALYESFLDGSEVRGSDPDNAELELRRFVAGAVVGAQPRNTLDESRWFVRLRSLLRPRLLAPIAAVAAVLVVVVINQMGPTDDAVLRDSNADAEIILHEATALESGGYQLAWGPVEGADAYKIRLLSADLAEIRTLGPVTALEHVVTPADGVADARFWQLIALQAGDEHARSSITALE